jgi:hypothetical protein
MSTPSELRALRERLLRAGIAPRHVRRYLRELADHLTDLTREEQREGRNPAEASAAAFARLGTVENLAAAMIGKPQLQSWSARAPWAAFGLAPLLVLAAAYFITCLYLWCGWQLFLPARDTPFGALHASPLSAANLYFQAGKMIYYLAPLLVGWAIALAAGRQRSRAAWPIVAALLTAWMGATARIQASRSALPNSLGHIHMGFFTTGASKIPGTLLVVAVIFTLSLLPYLLWRIHEA